MPADGAAEVSIIAAAKAATAEVGWLTAAATATSLKELEKCSRPLEQENEVLRRAVPH